MLICDFERQKVDDELCCPTCSWIYSSTTISTHPLQSRRHIWEVFDNSTDQKIAQHDDGTSSIFIYTWPYKSEFKVKLTVIESDNDRCSAENVYFDEDCFEPCPATGGGAAPSYKEETWQPPCNVQIKKAYIIEKKVNVEHIVTLKDVWTE